MLNSCFIKDRKEHVVVFSPGPVATANSARTLPLPCPTSDPPSRQAVPNEPGAKEKKDRGKAHGKQDRTQEQNIQKDENGNGKEKEKGKGKKKGKGKGKGKENSSNEVNNDGQNVVLEQEMSEDERRTRNVALIGRIRKCLNEEQFEAFKQISMALRTERITPAQYYSKFLDTFGRAHASEIFPELVALLPDPILRHALSTLHRHHIQSEPASTQIQENVNSKPTEPAASSQVPLSLDRGWSPCSLYLLAASQSCVIAASCWQQQQQQ